MLPYIQAPPVVAAYCPWCVTSWDGSLGKSRGWVRKTNLNAVRVHGHTPPGQQQPEQKHNQPKASHGLVCMMEK